MRRVVVPELLDSNAGTSDEITDSLQDLRWINKRFGGIATTVHLLRGVSKKLNCTDLTFLDVAAATGDVAEAARMRLAKEGVAILPTVLDRSTTHLHGDCGNKIVGDALTLPFRDESFDVVGSALFIHHLEPKQVLSFINESLRVSRYACIINDLRRSRLHLLATMAGRLFYRSPITNHDSAASVRRAYTRGELENIVMRTKGAGFEFRNHFLFRMGAIIWKKRAA